jgi:hypothetical protein
MKIVESLGSTCVEMAKVTLVYLKIVVVTISLTTKA